MRRRALDRRGQASAYEHAGFFDDDLASVDQDKTAVTPEIENAATSTALACATAA